MAQQDTTRLYQPLAYRIGFLLLFPGLCIGMGAFWASGRLSDPETSRAFGLHLSTDFGRAIFMAVLTIIGVGWLSRTVRLARGRADVILDSSGIDAAGLIRARRLSWENVAAIEGPAAISKSRSMVTIRAIRGRDIRLIPHFASVGTDEFMDELVRRWRSTSEA